jgi:hypothetical protein
MRHPWSNREIDIVEHAAPTRPFGRGAAQHAVATHVHGHGVAGDVPFVQRLGIRFRPQPAAFEKTYRKTAPRKGLCDRNPGCASTDQADIVRHPLFGNITFGQVPNRHFSSKVGLPMTYHEGMFL